MKYAAIIFGLLVVIIMIIVVIGYLLPVRHIARIQFSVSAAPEAVWRRLRDVNDYACWRKKLNAVERSTDKSWIEVDQRHNRFPLKIVEEIPPEKMVTEIDDPKLPFGGSWTFILGPGERGTIVTITEEGKVYNPIFRFVSKFIIGYSASIHQYANDLEGSFK